MVEDAIWQRELITALHLESLFTSEQFGSPSPEMTNALRPTPAECERAAASMRSWRTYLPEPCVAMMIDDGWQWSTT